MYPLTIVLIVVYCLGAASARSDTYSFDLAVDYVSANNNDLQTVGREAGVLVGKEIGSEVSVELEMPIKQLVSVKVSGADVIEARRGHVDKILSKFLKFRFDGHTFPYALFMTVRLEEVSELEGYGITRSNKYIFETVAWPWIRYDVQRCIAFPAVKEGERQAPLYVIDGDLAWLYIFPKKGDAPKDGRPVLEFRFDAIELSPATKPLIKEVFDELENQARTPTTNESIGSKWWYELQGILKKRHGLIWRSPRQLNPETLFD